MRRHQYRTVESRTFFRDDVLGLRVDVVATPHQSLVARKVIEYRRAVAVVAITDDGKVPLVRHFRYPIGKVLWELPGGMREQSETPIECARRELMEETGYLAERYERLLEFYPEPAFSDHAITILLASAAAPQLLAAPRPECAEDEPEIERVGLFDLSDTPRLVRDGLIGSSWTIIGMTMALARLGRGSKENK